MKSSVKTKIPEPCECSSRGGGRRPGGVLGPPDGIFVGAPDGFDAAVLASDGWTVTDELGVGLPLEEAAAGPHPATNAATAASHAAVNNSFPH